MSCVNILLEYFYATFAFLKSHVLSEPLTRRYKGSQQRYFLKSGNLSDVRNQAESVFLILCSEDIGSSLEPFQEALQCGHKI